jgi:hypothetical protein
MTIDSLAPAEIVVSYALEGRVPKQVLTRLLTPPARRAFGDACGAIEAKYTDACGSKGETCLEGGCAAAGERCLQSIIDAGDDYDVACTTEWAKLFADPANRDPSWRITVSTTALE